MNVRFIGRHVIKDGREYFSYSGCGFEFVVIPDSKDCSTEIKLTSIIKGHEDHYVAIFVNDVFCRNERLLPGPNKITVQLDKKAVVRIIKLNEGYLSAIYLDDIILHNGIMGEIEPSNRKLVGFFGDSITCGYGLLGYHENVFKTETEDFTKSYAYLSCFAANMDYSVVARSGISISIRIYQAMAFEEIYDTVDMFEKCREDRKLNFAVINLGTNDNNGYREIVKDEDKQQALQTFKKKYIELGERIIKDNPGVKLILCYDMIELLPEFVNALKEIHQYLCENFENKCKLLQFKSNMDGANFHPYKTAHEESAQLLTQTLKELK